MKRNFFRTLVALVLALSLCLVTAAPASADVTSATVGVVPTWAGEADAEYTIVFDVTAGLAADDVITIVFPDDTAVVDAATVTGTVNTIAIEAGEGAGDSATRTVTVIVPTAFVEIVAGGTVTLVLTAGITNPETAGDYTLTVATTNEVAAIESQIYTIVDEAATIAAANEALIASASAKLAHTTAGGLVTNTQYVAVITAEGTLTDALEADPQVPLDITNATAALSTDVTVLETFTGVLEAANTALDAVASALAAHTAAGGLEANTEYTAVEAAQTTLTTALAATPQVTGDIADATTALNTAVAALGTFTTVLGDATDAQTASAAAKLAHTDAGGLEANTEYVAVETAEGVLTDALTASPQLTGDIADATDALNTVVGALETFTGVLEAANTALDAVAGALAAHLAAGGFVTNTEYVAVETAEGVLTDALTASPQLTGDIADATTALNTVVADLGTFTTVLGDATDAQTASAAAKLAHTAAGGLATNTEYEAVETAEGVLTDALTASPQLTGDIADATTALNTVVADLAAFTPGLEAANTALTASAAAKLAHTDAGGLPTNTEYEAVVTAETDLNTALTVDPQVNWTIVEAATTALNTAVADLAAFTTTLAPVIATATEALDASATAKTAHIAAGGAVTDTEYANVETKEGDLNTALTAVPQVTVDITNATTALNTDVGTLVTATDALAAAIVAGDAALTASGLAKTAHIAAGGAVTDTEYEAVVTAETDLNTALTAVPKVTLDITNATDALDTAVTNLGTFSGVLEDANAALVLSAAAKTAHIAAGGDAEDAEYVAVVTEEGVLTTALAAVPKVTVDISNATGDLDIAVAALVVETEVLELAAAVAAGNDALTASGLAKTAHIAAGGLAEGLQYVAVEDAEVILTTALAVGPPQVTADVVAATTALNTAVANLEAVTVLLTTYDRILPLHDGWTLISTDKWIDSETSAWEGDATLKFKYTGVAFVEAYFDDLKPVEALYVKMPGGGWAGLNYLDAAPGMSAKELVEGWNLISSGTEADAGAVLSPLQDIGNQGTGLTTLVSQGGYNFTTGDWYIDASDWTNVTGETMNPFDGYWIYMNAAKSFGVILQ